MNSWKWRKTWKCGKRYDNENHRI